MPVPPDDLIARVTGRTDPAWFFQSGQESIRELQRTLAIAGRTLDSFESILDFGCGCGRMLLWLEELGRKRELHGTDVDPEAIEWCRENIPYAPVAVNGAEPPLPYPDGAFDLVFNHSVFTHIDERRQDLWLSELQRVVRAGGLLVLSVHGQVALPEGASALRDRLERDGIAYVDNSFQSEHRLPEWYQNTWHAPWYVFEHWGRWFEVRGYVPGAALGYQDHVLLERKSEPPRPPLAVGPRLAVEGRPSSRARKALADARAHRNGSAAGGMRGLTRRVILRAIRPYTAHEDNFDDAVAASIDDLTRAVDEQASVLRRLQNSAEDAG